MPTYRAPVGDGLFLLTDVLRIDRLGDLPGFGEMTPDLLASILGEAGRLAETAFLPLNRLGDTEGCARGADGVVRTPAGFREAYRAYCAGGWVGLALPPEFGGQGLPYALHALVGEFFSSANMALTMYPGLTQGAVAAILAHGTPEQKATYLPRLVDGSWSGTMNLTEPHCGTDLALLRTRAAPQGDGSYAVTGQKIFISAGEHDLTENIVHLVLARNEGAPEGVRGISLFLVPKVLPDGRRNGVSCGAIEKKMGIHGNATCAINYDGAAGFLLGEENGGLKAMFTMMNEARLAVASQGLAIGEVAGQNAAAYARERLQGRSLAGAEAPEKPADPIIVHPDIRLNLMTIRAFAEGGRALLAATALCADIARRSPDPAAREAADDRVGLMTPVLKGVLTDRGFEHAVLAQQVFGGHGYIEEHGMSQFVRDARIAMIYEGTNGIQALDLVGRKLAAHGGRAVRAFFAEVGAFCGEGRADEARAPLTRALKKGLNDLQAATLWLAENGMKRPQDAGAAATDYMHLFGLVAIGHMWGRMAAAAEARLAAGGGDRPFLEAKRVTARFYMERIMPETALRLARITAGSATAMALPAEAF